MTSGRVQYKLKATRAMKGLFNLGNFINVKFKVLQFIILNFRYLVSQGIELSTLYRDPNIVPNKLMSFRVPLLLTYIEYQLDKNLTCCVS